MILFKHRRELERLRKLEGERKRDCEEVLKWAAENLGYLARQICSREELSSLVAGGISAPDLFQHIKERIKTAPGVVLGYHLFGEGWPRIPVKVLARFRDRHIYAVGRTGSGKTNLIRNLVLQDLVAGNGFTVLAPELELIEEEILPYIPEERVEDVIYVDPGDTEKPVSFNPLQLEAGEDIDRTVDDLLVIFERAVGLPGARMRPILRNALYALVERGGTTLLDLYTLLSRDNSSWRDEVIRTTKNTMMARFFYEDYPTLPRTAHLPITNRLDSFVSARGLRGILCSPQSSFSFRKAMDEGKIVLFNLSDAVLGQGNAELLGQLVVSRFQQAMLSRAKQSKSARRPFYLYIDEFQSFVSTAQEGYEKILSRARKYNVGMILSHQQTKQVPAELLAEILGNVHTIVCFNVSQSDAKKLAKEFVDKDVYDQVAILNPENLGTLSIGEAFCKIGVNWVKMKTYLADQNPDLNWANYVKQASRDRYGITPLEETSAPKEVEGFLE